MQAKSSMAASHFPTMISKSLTGDVNSSSMVPLRVSSANSRIVTIGERNSRMMLKFPKVGWITNWLMFMGGMPWPMPIAPRPLKSTKKATALKKKYPKITANIASRM